jgi:Cdc6-like AAA superfamily ATPase
MDCCGCERKRRTLPSLSHTHTHTPQMLLSSLRGTDVRCSKERAQAELFDVRVACVNVCMHVSIHASIGVRAEIGPTCRCLHLRSSSIAHFLSVQELSGLTRVAVLVLDEIDQLMQQKEAQVLYTVRLR